MRTDEFDYALPEELIAQHPVAERDQARMMVIDRASGHIAHRCVRDLPEYVRAPDVLVLNDTQVIPARLLGVKEGTGGQVELLLLEELEPAIWDVLMRCSRRPKPGGRMFFGGGRLQAVMLEDGTAGRARVRFETEGPLLDRLEEVGVPPLPPYIKRKGDPAQWPEEDRARYQTIYARAPGSVAAPTAGLHFTPDLFDRLDAVGVQRAALTLHVGLGTFRPVSADEVEAHHMEHERYQLTQEVADQVNRAREQQGRVIAVGSTSVRVLETVAKEHGAIVPTEGRTGLYIYPPYTFRAVDGILTNFHLPKSTLLMMMCAFGGQALIMDAYATAVKERYRFYSYGDCMLIC